MHLKNCSPGILLATLLFTISTYTSAQEVVASAGENLQSNNIQLNFTLGQLVNTTASSSSAIVTQGFHQVFSEVVEALASPDQFVEINVFPNPASNKLTISSSETSVKYYTLYDLNGAKVASGNFKESTELAIHHFAKGMYQLLLTNDQEQLLETFKVQFK